MTTSRPASLSRNLPFHHPVRGVYDNLRRIDPGGCFMRRLDRFLLGFTLRERPRGTFYIPVCTGGTDVNDVLFGVHRGEWLALRQAFVRLENVLRVGGSRRVWRGPDDLPILDQE